MEWKLKETQCEALLKRERGALERLSCWLTMLGGALGCQQLFSCYDRRNVDGNQSERRPSWALRTLCSLPVWAGFGIEGSAG